MSKPIALYYVDAEHSFLLEVVKEIQKSSDGYVTGKVMRSPDVTYALLKGRSDFECEFLIMMERKAKEIQVTIRGHADFTGKMDISFREELRNLTPFRVVEAILNKIGVGLSISQDRPTSRMASHIAAQWLKSGAKEGTVLSAEWRKRLCSTVLSASRNI